jgi:hypothetical protein
LRKGVGEHVLHCDGNLKEFEQRCSAASYCQLQLPLYLQFVMSPVLFAKIPKLKLSPTPILVSVE